MNMTRHPGACGIVLKRTMQVSDDCIWMIMNCVSVFVCVFVCTWVHVSVSVCVCVIIHSQLRDSLCQTLGV